MTHETWLGAETRRSLAVGQARQAVLANPVTPGGYALQRGEMVPKRCVLVPSFSYAG